MLAMDATARTFRYLDAERGRSAASARPQAKRGSRRNEHAVIARRLAASLRRRRAAWPAAAAEQDELQQWMEQQQREVKPNVEPLSAAEEVRSRSPTRSASASSRSARRS